MSNVLEWFASAVSCCGKELGPEVLNVLDATDLQEACRKQVHTLLDTCRSAIDQHDYDTAMKILQNIDSASVLQEYIQLDVSCHHQDMRTYLQPEKKDTSCTSTITKEL